MIRLILLLIVLAAASSAPAGASTSPEDLVASGELTLDTSLSQVENIVPRQRVQLLVEVATARWFTGGTRITIPEVPGLVILQTEQFASNASEQRAGQTWVIQRWSLELYPQTEGTFTVPELVLNVSVSAGGAESAAGPVRAPGISFTATKPEIMATVDDWVAAPEFRVEQSLDKELDALAVGDAIERTVTFEARDVMAMMLPELPAASLDGVAAYPLPPTLENRNNRGVATAERVEMVSYVLQTPGDFRLPELEFAWWDTRNNTLQMVSLPAIEFSVAAAPATKEPLDRSRIRQLLITTGMIVLGLGATFLLIRLTLRLPWQRISLAWHIAMHRLRQLRQPALPEKLNPGSNAAD